MIKDFHFQKSSGSIKGHGRRSLHGPNDSSTHPRTARPARPAPRHPVTAQRNETKRRKQARCSHFHRFVRLLMYCLMVGHSRLIDLMGELRKRDSRSVAHRRLHRSSARRDGRLAITAASVTCDTTSALPPPARWIDAERSTMAAFSLDPKSPCLHLPIPMFAQATGRTIHRQARPSTRHEQASSAKKRGRARIEGESTEAQLRVQARAGRPPTPLNQDAGL
jgi:hypothetical protein